jgi:hypothetical protein
MSGKPCTRRAASDPVLACGGLPELNCFSGVKYLTVGIYARRYIALQSVADDAVG